MTDHTIVARFDPQTGERLAPPTPDEPLFDPYTGKPLRPLPRFDPFSGRRLPSASTRWWPAKPGPGFIAGHVILGLFLLLGVIGAVSNHRNIADTIVGFVFITLVGVPVITTI